MTDPLTILPHHVQTSVDFSTWTTRSTLSCTQASEGSGQVVGEATLVQNLGQVAQPGSAFASQPVLDLTGQFVRVLLEDGIGDVTIDGESCTPLWHGVVQGSSLQDDGGGSGSQTMHCSGLATVLDQLTVGRGAEARIGATGPGPSNVYDPGYFPPFNRYLGMDMSTASQVVGADGGTYLNAYAHQRSTYSRYRWTASSALDTVLTLCAHGEISPVYARGSALRWAFSDPSGCLQYIVQDVDIFAGSVLSAVNTLINARRGLTWRTVVTGTLATILVTSCTPTPVTGGTYTLPSAVTTHAPDLTGGASTGLAGVELTEDAGACYDVIEIVGAQPWIGMTVAFEHTPTAETALGKGWWTDDDPIDTESMWNNGDTSALMEKVWRRFKLRAEWLGNQYHSTAGLRNALVFAADGSTDGSRTHDRNGFTWQPETLQCTRTLPCGDGFNFSTFSVDGQQDPLLFIGADGNGKDMNGLRANLELVSFGEAIGVSIEEQPGAVILGHQSQDSNLLASTQSSGPLDTSEPILVTMGIRESEPLRVRWVRSSASWPRALPRVMTVRANQYEQWLVLPGTITGVDNEGAYLTTGEVVKTVRDDLPAMRNALALLRTWYTEPARSLRYLRRGIIDHSDATAPGVLVTTATLGVGARAINAPYVRRTWDFTTENYGTAWDTDRLVPDLEAVR